VRDRIRRRVKIRVKVTETVKAGVTVIRRERVRGIVTLRLK